LKQTLKILTLAFALSTALSWYKAPLWLDFAILSLSLAALGAYLRTTKHSFKVWLLALCFCVLGFLNVFVHNFISPKVSFLPGQQITLSGIVSEMPKNGSYGLVKIIVTTKNFGKVQANLKATSLKPTLGDFVRVVGKYSQAKEAGTWDEKRYLKSQGISFKISAGQIVSVKMPQTIHARLLYHVGRLQLSLTNIHKLLLPRQQASLMQAMLIGRSTGDPLDHETWLLGQNLGIVHIFAASALNLSALIWFLGFLLKCFKVPRKVRYSVLIFSTTFYATLAGWIPSIGRAWLMANTVLIGSLVRKRADLLSTLFFGLLTALIIDPNTIGDLGFQFSYLSTLGILLWNNKLVRRMNFLPASWAAPIAVTITAQALILPLQLWYFGNLALYSVLANLLAVPLANFILIFGLLGSLLSLFGPIGWFLASVTELGASAAINLLSAWMHLLGSLPGADFKLPKVGFGWIIWLLAVSLGLGFFANKPYTKHILLASACCLLVFSVVSKTPQVTFQSLSKRWYEALLVTNPDGSRIFVCHQAASNYPSDRLLRDLRKLAVTKIDWWIGNCKAPSGLEVVRQIEAKNKMQLNITKDFDLTIGREAVLLSFKNLSALVLFQPLTTSAPGQFYSVVKLAYNHEEAQSVPWSLTPKAQFCLMPHLAKTERKQAQKLLEAHCGQVYDHLQFKNQQIKSDGSRLKMIVN
jgi:competence protein ComEC